MILFARFFFQSTGVFLVIPNFTNIIFLLSFINLMHVFAALMWASDKGHVEMIEMLQKSVMKSMKTFTMEL